MAEDDKRRFPGWPSDRHPAPRPYSWVYSEPDGIAYVYDANGKQIAFGPVEQIVKLFEGKHG